MADISLPEAQSKKEQMLQEMTKAKELVKVFVLEVKVVRELFVEPSGSLHREFVDEAFGMTTSLPVHNSIKSWLTATRVALSGADSD